METSQKSHEEVARIEKADGMGTVQDVVLRDMGYEPVLPRARSLKTILFMTLSIAAVPYGMGSALIVGIYGGGPLTLFVGLLVVLALDGCVALSLAELASRFPTSAGPYYWTYRMTQGGSTQRPLSYLTGWVWLIGNWTITLSVNFGFASLLAGTIAIYDPSYTATDWQLLLIFYAVCVLTFFICAAGDKMLPYIDAGAAVMTLLAAIAVAVALAATAGDGRHSAAYALGHYDASFSGWGSGFAFFIGLLPPAYTFSALGMVTSMAEECSAPETQLPVAMSLCVPIGGVVALIFVLPICFTLPDMAAILEAPYAQALPYILYEVMKTQAGAVVVMVFVFMVTMFCSISITTTASRCTFAFARDRGMPLSGFWSKTWRERPLAALMLVTVVEMLLGLIDLGSTSAFTAFASVGVIALAVGYLIPIAASLAGRRSEVDKAEWKLRSWLGYTVNVIAILWIAFELVLFSMPVALPVTKVSMNYASVVFVGFLLIGLVFYAAYARKSFHLPGM